MNEQLRDIIRSFRAAQDLGVTTLVKRLGVTLPTSNVEWGCRYDEMALTEKGEEIGVRIQPNLFGMEMVFPGVSVPLVWGDLGEGYGFDHRRLWEYCEMNGLFIDMMTSEDLKAWMDEALESGDLVEDDFLMYLREERFGAARKRLKKPILGPCPWLYACLPLPISAFLRLWTWKP